MLVPSFVEAAHKLTKASAMDSAEFSAKIGGLGGCPYFLSRAALCDADIVVLPYPYLLDPFVRAATFLTKPSADIDHQRGSEQNYGDDELRLLENQDDHEGRQRASSNEDSKNSSSSSSTTSTSRRASYLKSINRWSKDGAADEFLKDKILILDEAHNIDGFCREVCSFDVSIARLVAYEESLRAFLQVHVKVGKGATAIRGARRIEDLRLHPERVQEILRQGDDGNFFGALTYMRAVLLRLAWCIEEWCVRADEYRSQQVSLTRRGAAFSAGLSTGAGNDRRELRTWAKYKTTGVKKNLRKDVTSIEDRAAESSTVSTSESTSSGSRQDPEAPAAFAEELARALYGGEAKFLEEFFSERLRRDILADKSRVMTRTGTAAQQKMDIGDRRTRAELSDAVAEISAAASAVSEMQDLFRKMAFVIANLDDFAIGLSAKRSASAVGSWTATDLHLDFHLLNASKVLDDVMEPAHSVIVSSGTLCAELGEEFYKREVNGRFDGLHQEKLNSSCIEDEDRHEDSGDTCPILDCSDFSNSTSASTTSSSWAGHQQGSPKQSRSSSAVLSPLRSAHVIKSSQLLVQKIERLKSGQRFSTDFGTLRSAGAGEWSTRSFPYGAGASGWNQGMLEDLGETLVDLASVIPGGMLVFFPNYAMLKECFRCWKKPSSARETWHREGRSTNTKKTTELPSVYERLVRLKIFVAKEAESTDVDKLRDQHNAAVDEHGHALLFGVMRGKCAEGISYDDAYARGVVLVGIPYSTVNAASVYHKREHNRAMAIQKQRSSCGGISRVDQQDDWYATQAFTAVNQSLGRCIRHSEDYGAIFLLDARWSYAGHEEKLSKWVQDLGVVRPPAFRWPRMLQGVTDFYKRNGERGTKENRDKIREA
ncbi:unnamed protein product [Amoebophrya sp. A25]|nr:unnamed protein product [Amoebophrya sp. A25]|eukprot:GSA25T00008876001.1